MLLIIGKIFLSVFLLGFVIGGVVKLSSSHRNPDINPKIEYFVGALGLVSGLLGMFFTWSNLM